MVCFIVLPPLISNLTQLSLSRSLIETNLADLSTTFLREVRWNSILAPIFSSDGLKAIFGVRENSIRGWTATAQNSNDFSENGNVVKSVTANAATPREGMYCPPVSLFFTCVST